MKTDARIARAGGCVRLNSQPDKTEILLHPHRAHFWMISVATAGKVSCILPKDGASHLRKGYCLTVENHGAGGTGTIEFLDASAAAITFFDGSLVLDPGEVAHVYLQGFELSGAPSWVIISRPVGAYAAP